MVWKPQPNLTGAFPMGYDYPRTGLSFDPDSEARRVSYEEYLEDRKKAEEEEEKRRKSQRDTDFAVNVALMGAQGKFVFIVDAVHEITDDVLRQNVKGCQFQLFHFTTIEETFQWLTTLIDQCTDDAKSKMAIVLYHLEQLVSIPVLINAQKVNTIMRMIMTPNGAISEQKLATMAKRMLETVLSQAEASGVTVEHIFDYKEISNG